MMMFKSTLRFFLASLLLVLASATLAQGFSGTFTIEGQNSIALSLQDTNGQLQGTLSGNGVQYRLEGQSEAGEAYGVMRDQESAVYFLIYFQGPQLVMIVADVDPNTRQPVTGSEQTLTFTPTGTANPGGGQANPLSPSTPLPAGNPLAPGNSSGYEETYIEGDDYDGVDPSFGEAGSHNPEASTPLAPDNPLASTQPLGNPLTRATSTQAPTLQANNTVEVQAGGQYNEGMRLNSSPHGISFIIPPAWNAFADPAALVMRPNGKNGLGLVLATVGVTAQDLASYLSNDQDMGNGIVLMPTAQPQIQGDRVYAQFAGSGYGGSALAIMGQNNNAILFFFAGEQTEIGYYSQLLESLASSVSFNNPTVLSTLQQYDAAIRGKMLYSFGYSGSTSTSNSYGVSREKNIYLCSNGQFLSWGSSESGGNFSEGAWTPTDAGGVAGQSNSQASGSWRVGVIGANIQLLLQATTGELSFFTLGNNGQYLTLDGQEVTLNANNQCP
jgi:hypothetical protein